MPDSLRLVVTEHQRQGVIESIDDWFDPADQDDLDDLLAVIQDQIAREEALLLAARPSKSSRLLAEADGRPSGSADHLNRVPKYVASSTMTDPNSSNTAVLSGSLEDEVADLKTQGHAVTWG